MTSPRTTVTLFSNATIATMDPARPQATAILVRDGKVAALGDAAGLAREAPSARRVDLGGRFVCPGFVDAHNHFSLTALEPVSLDCRAPHVRSLDDLTERVRLAAAALRPGQWLRGHGYDESQLGGEHPDRAVLTRAAPHNPVVLVHWTVHRCAANDAAIRAAGIAERDPDLPGAWKVRGPEGTFTGVCYERATDPLQAASISDYARTFARRLPALFAENAARMLRQGITAVGDAYVHPALAPFYRARGLPITVRPFCGSPEGLFAPPEACLMPEPPATGGPPLPHGVKLFADGGGNTTATSLASGRPPRFLFYRQDALDALVARAHGAGLPVAIHAAGDIAVSMALDAIERARLAHPSVEPRFRIEHAITLKSADIPRFRALDVALVTQPEAVFQAGPRLARAGLAPGVRIAPFRDLLAAGVRLAFSSDSPCYALPPLWQIWCATTRRTVDVPALDDGQDVSVDDALAAYTRGGAAAIFDPDGGTLTPGQRADFVVLSADPRRGFWRRWSRIAIDATYVRGRATLLPEPDGLPPPGRPVPLT